jgi:hypothetical protein
MGVITQWNDPRIVNAQTPGIAAALGMLYSIPLFAIDRLLY